MAHLVRNEPWGVTDLDLVKGHVFVRQDWRYQWMAGSHRSPWTPDERFHYHRAVDHVIWARWSLRARLDVRLAKKGADHQPAPGELVSRFGERGLTMSFDVRSVVGPAHWQVNVHKTDPAVGPLPRSTTDFARRILELHDTDLLLRHASRQAKDSRKQTGFSVLAHEFGHAIGYANPRGHLDEYEKSSPFFDDVHSIMNIGRHLRARHLSLITETLAQMIPACRFQAVVQPR